MNSLQQLVDLQDAGRFTEALTLLENSRFSADERLMTTVIKAELLQSLGKTAEARTLALTLLDKAERLSLEQRSASECVLGKLAREEADIDRAIEHLQRAVALARRAKDLKRLCRAQLPLVLYICERCTAEAASPLIAELRSNAVRLGDARTTAAVHIFVGEIEAKQGRLQGAYRHGLTALRLLRDVPNVWLESFAENLLTAICLLRSDFNSGLLHGLRAFQLAEQSGSAGMRRATAGNLGNLYYWSGDFDGALDYFDRAVRSFPTGGDTRNWSLESIARVRLSQGRLDECEVLLNEIDDSIVRPEDHKLFAHRYAAMARATLLGRQGRLGDAVSQTDVVIALTDAIGDRLLRRRALFTKAELLLTAGNTEAAFDALDAGVQELDVESVELYAQYERVLAIAFSRVGQPDNAIRHSERARRICRGLGNVPAEIDLNTALLAESQLTSTSADTNLDRLSHGILSANILHGVAALLTNASRPEIVARELFAILAVCGPAVPMALRLRNEDGSREILDRLDSRATAEIEAPHCAFEIGIARNSTLELVLCRRADVASVATMNAVTQLVAAVHELQRARAEREERATLWPTDELPVEGDRTVISGHMRELMNLARRVARANVIVLISGESGTGKEIVAHAIHAASDRAQKPFVPVNCAAVPRELLESQLFGHRRGAFTGADRDHTGLIRAAEGGTLFLDEIGELGIDLQPKLLRFLESNEISPLGETTAFKVNVRIVAATNRNLEDLVRDGRFREDLFYRLNVVPLSIKPLRERRDEIPGLVHYFTGRAAEECRKGHVSVAEETMERLLLYRWPGNVRQLQNELRRMVALAETDATLLPDDISPDILGSMPLLHHAPVNGRELAVTPGDNLPQAIARIECEMIKGALKTHHGRVDAAAKALGISRKGLYLKRQRLGL
jgi:DNA-binding NtrC family response regulator/tetratricopeptide (TPR) repeat protein